MDSELYKNIANSTAHRASREQNADFILNNPELFSDFLKLAFDTNDKNHHKACWILELVLEEKIHFLTPFLNQFCNKITNYTNESALRSISKICLFLAKHISLSKIQDQKIIEACFDWLIIENGKVATKAYSIRALFEFGKKSDWIYPELQRILSEDYVKHSAAYKAVAREVLKKIK
ncbi:hypothetical protein [Flavobacterium sp.]|uniref:hypothetical protein n=1 Tax=Flavobacterium sp. TaxID=239 RepID=UPI002B4B3CE3|nr:hypothetical protein [Flavobacterium sp.]HLF52172.1 hypothetical protein [Flavobacterium sp.]